MLSKKAEKASRQYYRATPKEDLAIAKVTSGKGVRPGPYNLLPVVGSVHRTSKSSIVYVTSFMLHVVDDRHVGVLSWVLPYNERTAHAVTKLVTSLGWDGRVWPDDGGWPAPGKEAEGLRKLLQGQNLTATLSFPPHQEHGNLVLRQEILRTSAEFPLDPNVGLAGIEPSQMHLDRLRALAVDPSIFGMGGL